MALGGSRAEQIIEVLVGQGGKRKKKRTERKFKEHPVPRIRVDINKLYSDRGALQTGR
jgi:hypothetical protein